MARWPLFLTSSFFPPHFLLWTCFLFSQTFDRSFLKEKSEIQTDFPCVNSRCEEFFVISIS